MTAEAKILVDAAEPATLRYADKQVDCLTLQEAVLEWNRLPQDQKQKAEIRAGKMIYRAAEIDRLYKK